MLRTAVRSALRPRRVCASQRRAAVATSMADATQHKREGDISDAFASLSGLKDEPLPEQFRQLKLSLVSGREERIKASWNKLIAELRAENDAVAKQGSRVIPEVRYENLVDDLASAKDEIKKRGAAVIRGMIPEDEARGYKFELDEYVRKNPQTKGERVFL